MTNTWQPCRPYSEIKSTSYGRAEQMTQYNMEEYNLYRSKSKTTTTTTRTTTTTTTKHKTVTMNNMIVM